MLLQNSKAGESLVALIASPLSITLTWGQGMIDREALGQPVHPSNRSILQVSLLVTHSILSQLSPVTSLRNLLHKVLLLENCLWWSAAIYHGPEIRGNSLTLHIAEQSSVIYSTTHSCQTRRLSLPPTLASTSTPGILGNRRLPGLSIHNLMALSSVLKPFRNLIIDVRNVTTGKGVGN